MTEAEAMHWHLTHPGEVPPPDVAELLADLFDGPVDGGSTSKQPDGAEDKP